MAVLFRANAGACRPRHPRWRQGGGGIVVSVVGGNGVSVALRVGVASVVGSVAGLLHGASWRHVG